jgi:adenine-specific DNA-methyltransferase
MSDKMKFETPNLTTENVAKIAALFPGVVVEGKVNIDLLRTMLGEDVFADEAYEFTWVGKRAAIAEAGRPIRKTLRPAVKDEITPTGSDSTGNPYCSSGSKEWDTTENLYIEGDNLDVLKLLQESYLGKVKMIYIDPPYNTGNDFVYRDKFTTNREDYEEEAGAYDEQGDRLFRNTETNGRFHSDWCSMMYSRLVLARSILSDDGVIFISIDDSEQRNMRNICDEIYGEDNFIATIIRNTNSSKNQSLFVSVSHEYCLIYGKNLEYLKAKHAEHKWEVPKNNVSEYIAKVKQLQKEGLSQPEITEELKALTKYPRFIDFTNYWYFDENGLYSKGDLGGVPNGNTTPIMNPITGNYDPVPPGGFRFSVEKMKGLTEKGRIHFHTDGSLPRIKRYLSENLRQRPKSIMSDDQRPDSALMHLFNTPFDNPKQLAFMQRIISIADNDSIVLDFFSGSATTAHAVMQLNAEDGGKRKFIMVQLPEVCAEGTEAAKVGYRNICEIGKERIRRAGDKIKDEVGLTAQGLDIGFRVLKLDETNMNEVYYAAGDYTQDMIMMMQSNIKEDRTDMDLLYGCLLDWGLPLSMPHTHEKIDGFTAHTYNGGDLIACFEESISEKAVREIANRKPLRAVFRDSGFTSSPEKINVFEIFKLLAPNTTVRVI